MSHKPQRESMKQKTLEEFKTEYITEEKIENMVKMGSTQEQAKQHYNQLAEEIYILYSVQPMSNVSFKSTTSKTQQ